MLESNDFGKENAKYIQDNNREALALGMLELCADFALQIDRQKVLSEDSGNSNRMYFAVGTTSSVFKDRKVYEPIMRLSQDLQFSKRELGDMKKGLAEARKAAEPKMMRAIERQELLFLPANHSIEMLEYQKFSELYGIDQNIEDASKQVRLCVTINSYNNVGNNRNIKLLKSVLRQNYKNYHIVFNDDHSTDGTMQQTIDFLKKANFPQERVTYVQNLRNNFAYYNCLNAAYNFCGEDDVQLILDGDDEVLGSYAFHVMNVGYQKDKTNDLWVYYSTHKTNYYQLGRSRGIGYYREYEYSMDTPNGKVRKLVSAIGQITTWRVKVLFGITKENTRMANGEWIDAGYDDSITQPLAELCTVDRFKYIHELLYEYNRYSNNEDSTPAGADHRRTIYKHLLGLKMLKPLTTLNGQKRNPELEKEFI
jgi:glycosyltransferase involved in cell wall biosynthesis